MMLKKLSYTAFRVETGPLQFDGDWPGFFFRGDDAVGTAGTLREIAKTQINETFRSFLLGLAEKLESSQRKN